MAEFLQVRSQKIYHERRERTVNNYKMLYRFTEQNVEYVAEEFLGQYQETRGGALTSKQRMQIFLRYMADPGFQIGVGEDVGVHRTTVCKTVKFVMDRILLKSDNWIKFPRRAEDILAAKSEWSTKFRFPNAIAAIDCTHVAIPKPQYHGDEYVNRKGVSTINVQATCNAKEIFTSVDAQWPGSVHDSRILRRSSLYAHMAGISSCVILGDSGYGIHPWLMTPYKNPLTAAQKYYNNIHAQDRCIIENCFGQLKRRFPILKYGVRTKLTSVPKIIICCFMLHNVAKYLNDSNDEFNDEEDDEEETDNTEVEEYDASNIRNEGKRKRLNITNVLFEMRNN